MAWILSINNQKSAYKVVIGPCWLEANFNVIQSVRKQIRKQIICIVNLQAELERHLPSASSGGSVQSLPVVAKLKKMMEEVETMKAERDVVETEINNAVFDMGE